MVIETTEISEFISLYKKQYGISLTQGEAIEYGIRLINFVKAVYGDNFPELETIDNSN